MKYVCEDCIKTLNLKPTEGFIWYAMQECALCGESKLKVADIKKVTEVPIEGRNKG